MARRAEDLGPMLVTDFARLSESGSPSIYRINGGEEAEDDVRGGRGKTWLGQPDVEGYVKVYEKFQTNYSTTITSGCLPVFAPPVLTRTPQKPEEKQRPNRKGPGFVTTNGDDDARDREYVDENDQSLSESAAVPEPDAKKSKKETKKRSPSSASRKQQQQKKKKKRSVEKSKGSITTGVEFVIEHTFKVSLERKPAALPIRLGLKEGPSFGVVVVELAEHVGNKSKAFSKIRVEDELLSIDGTPIGEDETLEKINERIEKSRVLVFAGVRRRHVPRLTSLMGEPIEPGLLYEHVEKAGGFEHVCSNRIWERVRLGLGLGKTTSSGNSLRKAYELYFEDLLDG